MICDCCGREVDRVASDDALCTACVCVWYDEGITDKAEIKRLVLEGVRWG
ncbi:MAG: hypothetical protein ACYSW3_00015 [Planctomycetota bacterium]|jgi:hypothetical protein